MSRKNTRRAQAGRKRDARDPTAATPRLDITTPDAECSTPPLAGDALKVQVETPTVNADGEREKVVVWLGPVVPHTCPKCGAMLLQDRSSKACIVTSTRRAVTENGRKFIDRNMKCQHCRSPFTAREYIND